METKHIDLSVYQENFLRFHIRSEILRLTSLLTFKRVAGRDSPKLLVNIDELKTLYLQIFREPYKTLKEYE